MKYWKNKVDCCDCFFYLNKENYIIAVRKTRSEIK